jgi:peroxiredoxin
MDTSSRDGEAGLCPAEPKRGKAWKPSQGFQISDGEAGLCVSVADLGCACRGLRLVTVLLAAGCASAQLPLSNVSGAVLSLTEPGGGRVALDDLWRTHEATVLVFWSGGCPCVRRYQDRVDQLLDRYPDQRVRVVGVSSNAGESFTDVLQVAKQRGVRLPILRDEEGQVAQAVGVHSTPTVVVIDGKGQIRFRGWIDNERLPDDPGREPWLDRAIQGLLADQPFAARTPVYGCAITRSLFGPPSGHCCHEQH